MTGRASVLSIAGLLVGCRVGAAELSGPVEGQWVRSPDGEFDARLAVVLDTANPPSGGGPHGLPNARTWMIPCLEMQAREVRSGITIAWDRIGCRETDAPTRTRWGLTRDARALLATGSLAWGPERRRFGVNAGDKAVSYEIVWRCGGVSAALATDGAKPRARDGQDPREGSRDEQILGSIAGIAASLAFGSGNDFPSKRGLAPDVRSAFVVLAPGVTMTPLAVAEAYNKAPVNRDIPMRFLSARCVRIVPSLPPDEEAARKLLAADRWRVARSPP